MPFGFRRGSRKGGGWGRGFRGGRGSEASKPSEFPSNCICPHCGSIEPHKPGTPCFQTKCPQCGSLMTRMFFHEE